MKKIALCIIDGFGINKKDDNNLVKNAKYFQKLLKDYPNLNLKASGEFVGLTSEQFGNSEVGHSTIGLGRILKQNLLKINDAIKDGSLKENEDLKHFLKNIKINDAFCHVVGLISDGGVHSHIDQILKIIDIICESGVKVLVHAILDGRDSPQRSAENFLNYFSENLNDNAKIVSLCGRFYAMDRDNRWIRTEDAYDLIANQNGYLHTSGYQGLFQDEYYKKFSDEFIEPTMIGEKYETSKHDGLFFVNFRSDRMKQIVKAFGDPNFNCFDRKGFKRFENILSIVEYDEAFSEFCTPLIKKQSVSNSIGEIISKNGLKQVRVAETEKYAHVTYFFNGGVDCKFSGEDHILIDSPKVETYDTTPEMKSIEITNVVDSLMKEKKYDLIVFNYAAPDMIGHTGNSVAAEKTIKCIDSCLEKIVNSSIENDYTLLITSDHGNIEEMIDKSGNPHTSHTLNDVPFIAINLEDTLKINNNIVTPQLSNIAPSILNILQIPIPEELSKDSLIIAEEK